MERQGEGWRRDLQGGPLPLCSPPLLSFYTHLSFLQRLQIFLSQESCVQIPMTSVWAAVHASSPSYKSVRSELCRFWPKATPLSVCTHTVSFI